MQQGLALKEQTIKVISMEYPSKNTALILVDPYNDFMSPKGKAWPLASKVTKEVNLIEHMQAITQRCRQQGWTIAYAPHHRFKKGSFSERKYLHPSQILQQKSASFKADSFGSEFYPSLSPQAGDTISSEHDCSSGFTGTNLHEQLSNKGITHVVLAGFLSNTCIESTARSAIDLGYHVTLLDDAVSAWSPVDHKAAVEVNYPLLAHRLTNTRNFLRAFHMETSPC